MERVRFLIASLQTIRVVELTLSSYTRALPVIDLTLPRHHLAIDPRVLER